MGTKIHLGLNLELEVHPYVCSQSFKVLTNVSI